MELSQLPVLAGSVATTIFVGSYLPMLVKAVRTRDLSSYSRSSLVLANVGNMVQTAYVVTLPVGPIWGLHTFYLLATVVMLLLHLRQAPPRPRPSRIEGAPRRRNTSPAVHDVVRTGQANVRATGSHGVVGNTQWHATRMGIPPDVGEATRF